MAVNRYERMNEEIKRVLCEIIRDMKDPRISNMTTVTSVEVTNDLKWAKAKISVYDEDNALREATVEALNKAAGFITHELGLRMELRALPKFKFTLDNSIEYSVHIAKVLDELHKEKEEGKKGTEEL